MDIGSRYCRKRLYIVYILTFSLLFWFFHHLMWINLKSMQGLSRLREDVDCLSKSVMHQQKYCKTNGVANTLSCIQNDNQGSSSIITAEGACDSRELNSYVDSLVKSKLGSLSDDVSALKKQVTCAACKNQNAAESEALMKPRTRINYASEEMGARITQVLAQPIGGTSLFRTLLGLDFSTNSPINILRPSITPGSCFGYSGSKSTVAIRLAKPIVVDEISLTHIPKEMNPMECVNNAPKDFKVYGILLDKKKKELFGEWTYDNSPKKRIQTFSVCNKGITQNLVFEFTSNHGGNTTCIYRVEVYGKIVI